MRVRASIAIAILALAYLFSPFLLLCTELLLNPLAPGSGGILPWLLLAYLILVIWLPPKWALPSKVTPTGLFGLGFLYILGIIEFFLPVKKLGLKAGGPLTFVFKGEVSSTAWYHIHNSKAIFGVFFPEKSYTYDPGLVFAPHYSKGLLLTHLILFIGLAVCLIGSLLSHKKALPTLLTFSLLVTCVNGGLLSSPVVIALPLFIYLTGQASGKVAGVLALLLAFLPALLLHEVLWLERIRLILSTLCAFGVLELIDRRERRVLTLCGLGVLTVLLSLPEWRIMNYAFTRIAKGDTIYVVTPQPYAGEVLETHAIGRSFLSKIVAETETSVYSVCKEQSLNLRRHPVMTSVVPQNYRFVAFGYGKLSELISMEHPLVTTQKATYLGETRYHLDLTFAMPVNINVVAGIFYDLGIEKIVIDERRI